MSQFSRQFGKVLRELRQDRKLSQERLAEISNLDRTFVSMIERGKRRATLDTAKQLAEALGVSLAQIIRRIEKEPSGSSERSGLSP